MATYVLSVTVPRRTVARLEDIRKVGEVLAFIRIQQYQAKGRAIYLGTEDRRRKIHDQMICINCYTRLYTLRLKLLWTDFLCLCQQKSGCALIILTACVGSKYNVDARVRVRVHALDER